MRVFVGIAVFVLCAAVAHGVNINYPDELTKANSLLPNGAHLGRFLIQVQVPDEPEEQTKQTLGFFVGAWGAPTPGVRSIAMSGLALTWTAESHWIASVGSVFCDPSAGKCEYRSAPGAEMKVQTANMIMLNITDLQKKYMMGYAVSVPSKKISTGTITDNVLDQTNIVGVYAAAGASNVEKIEQFPESRMMVLNIAYSASIDPKKDIPLKWDIGDKSKWGQKFVQQGEWLDFNWQ